MVPLPPMPPVAPRSLARFSWLPALALLLVSCAAPKLPPVSHDVAPAGSTAFASQLSVVAKAPWTYGNDVRTLVNGRAFYPAMLTAIRNAKHSVTFENYVAVDSWQVKHFTDAFIERARAGAAVHVILDAFGCNTYGKGHIREMREAGVQVLQYNRFNPLRPLRFNHRTHRRILVADGTVGFVGGAGLAYAWDSDAEDTLRWRDTQYEIRGPVVRQLQDAFNDNWRELSGVALAGPAYYPPLPPAGAMAVQVALGSPAHDHAPIGGSMLLAIRGARHSIRIAHPYFIPIPELVDALLAAAGRGVDIEILMPGEETDMHIAMPVARPAFLKFLESGIRLHAYQPTMMHGKLMVIDELLTIAGSANIDPRSFFINDENNVHVLSRSFAAEQLRMFAADRKRSIPLSRQDLRLSMGRRIQGFLGRRLMGQL